MDDINTNAAAAPFNNAIDCLMKISDIITKIQRVSTEYVLYTDIPGIRLSSGQAQHIKHRLIRMLIIRAAPLMSENARIESRKKIMTIKTEYSITYDKVGKRQTRKETYSEEIDLQMDALIFYIVTDLQDKGKYYMPPRDDPRRAVLRH